MIKIKRGAMQPAGKPSRSHDHKPSAPRSPSRSRGAVDKTSPSKRGAPARGEATAKVGATARTGRIVRVGTVAKGGTTARDARTARVVTTARAGAVAKGGTVAKGGSVVKAGTVAKARPRRPGSKAIGQDSGERLQKILAAAGVASRRACEQIILDGRVQVNGKTITELGTKADSYRDEITVDLLAIRREQPVYILVNKPKGYMTTVKDEEGRPTVMALLHGIEARVYPVGRLDFNSEGLLLMTNDGAMAKRLTDPGSHIPKVYLVKIHRMPKPETLDEFRGGFRLDGRRLKPCGIEIFEKAENPWLKVTLTEGKNQQIRKMFAAVGHPVSKLKRIQFGPLDDPFLKPGEWRFLNPNELVVLKSL